MSHRLYVTMCRSCEVVVLVKLHIYSHYSVYHVISPLLSLPCISPLLSLPVFPHYSVYLYFPITQSTCISPLLSLPVFPHYSVYLYFPITQSTCILFHNTWLGVHYYTTLEILHLIHVSYIFNTDCYCIKYNLIQCATTPLFIFYAYQCCVCL